MTRSGYEICHDNDDLIRYQVTLEWEIKCGRGQAFLRELLTALDALPEKALIKNDFTAEGWVCALGAVFAARGVAPPENGINDAACVAADALGIPGILAAEVMYKNDDGGPYLESPERRWARMREWVEKSLGGNHDDA